MRQHFDRSYRLNQHNALSNDAKSSLLATATLNSQRLRALGDLGTRSAFTLPAACDIGTSGEDRTKLLHAFTLWFREFSAGTTDGRRFGMWVTPSYPVIQSSERVNRGINTVRRSVLRPNDALAEVQICPESVACPQPGIWQRASKLEDVLKRAQAAATSRESLSFPAKIENPPSRMSW